MFTGLVQALGRVRRLDEGAEARRIEVEVSLAADARELGASVAVSGVCLTVVRADPQSFEADIAFETLERTTLGALRAGDAVNIEPSLRMGDPLGGHLVSGHVDGVGQIRSIEARGEARQIAVDVPPALRRYIAEKGSICIDGVSLTVNAVDAQGFWIGLVPHTLEVTTLGRMQVGTPVNLEVDLLARYVERILTVGGQGAREGLSMDKLAQAGFVGKEHTGIDAES